MTPQDAPTLHGRYSLTDVTPHPDEPGVLRLGPQTHPRAQLRMVMQLWLAIVENVVQIPHAFMIAVRPSLTVGDQPDRVYDLVMDYTSCPEGLHEIHTFLGGALREQIQRRNGWEPPTHRVSMVVEGESHGVTWLAQTSYDLVPAEYGT